MSCPTSTRNGITKTGHAVGVEYDGGTDPQGPNSAMRAYQDGHLVFSTTQKWLHTKDGWELDRLVMTNYENDIPIRETVVKVAIRHLDVALVPASSRWGLQVADVASVVGAAATSLFVPAPLFAQGEPIIIGDGVGWVDHIGGLLITAIAYGVAVVEGTILAIVASLVCLGIAAGMLGYYAGSALTDACVTYGDAIRNDPTYYSSTLDFWCK